MRLLRKTTWSSCASVSGLLGMSIWTTAAIGLLEGQVPPAPDKTTTAWQAMSVAERSRSHLFDKYKMRHRVLDLGGHTKTLEGLTIMPAKGDPPVRLPSMAARIASMVCSADAVFTGVASSPKSMPIEDGTFLFTDYQFKIDRVFRSARPLSQNDIVVVTRPGGDSTPPSPPGSTYLWEFPRLPNSQPLLLIVKAVEGDGAFETRDPLGAFTLVRGQGQALIRFTTSEGDFSTSGIPSTQLIDLVNKVECSARG